MCTTAYIFIKSSCGRTAAGCAALHYSIISKANNGNCVEGD